MAFLLRRLAPAVQRTALRRPAFLATVTPGSLRSVCRQFATAKIPKTARTEEELDKDKHLSEDVLRKRLLFRCKNRGIKELDLLMGNWARVHIGTLSTEHLAQLQSLLKEETLDLMAYLIKKEEAPEHCRNEVFQMIGDWRDSGNVTGYRKA